MKYRKIVAKVSKEIYLKRKEITEKKKKFQEDFNKYGTIQHRTKLP